jgi:broad specificity phosphatase PhoE
MSDLEEVWWYNPHPGTEPNCSRLKRLAHKEPGAALRERVEAFRGWLNRRPERLVVAVGHSLFWRAFLGDAHSMGNCEVKLCLH